MLGWQFVMVLALWAVSIGNGILAYKSYQHWNLAWPKKLVTLEIAVTIYTGGYLYAIATHALAAISLWQKIEWLGVVIIPCLWLELITCYVRQGGRRQPLLFGMLLSVSLTVLLLKSAGWNRVQPIYGSLVMLAGDYLLFGMRSNTAPVYRSRIYALMAVSVLPWFGSVFESGGFDLEGLELSPLSFALSGLISGWYLLKDKRLDLRPLVCTTLLETMPDGVVVLDSQDRIIGYNPAAAEFLEDLGPAALGSSVGEFAHYQIITDQIANHAEQKKFRVLDRHGEKYIESRLTPLISQSGKEAGKLIALRDVTQQNQLRVGLTAKEEMEVLGKWVAALADNMDDLLAAGQDPAQGAKERPGESLGLNEEDETLTETDRKTALSSEPEKIRKVPLRTPIPEAISTVPPFLAHPDKLSQV